MPRGRGHFAEPRKLFVYVCDWCVYALMLFFKLVFRIKDWWEIGCQLKYQFS